ncbi:MAG: AIR synthase-related protein [Planctomycetales bacterium]
MRAREEFGFRPVPESDCAPLHTLNALQRDGIAAKAVRGRNSRRGVTSILHEAAEACAHSLEIHESKLPVTPEVRAVCELLGLDPWHLANEGTFVAVFPPQLVKPALSLLRTFPQSAEACVIGEVTPRKFSTVLMTRTTGRTMPLDESAGAPLPRIC